MKTLILGLSLGLMTVGVAHADRLDDIQKEGVLRVGTTGDYRPFSYHDGETLSGYDIDVAKHMADQLGVKVEFVETTWKGLLDGLAQDQYDIAMGGITRKMQRQLNAEQTQGYMTFGKCFLVAKGNTEKYDTLEEANQASTKVGYNIGGTNELFAKEHLTSAKFTTYENNLDVPEAVAEGKVDVMVTETPEALYYQSIDKRLEASSCADPFTKSQFGYLIPKGEQRLLNTVNFIMDEMKLKGVEEDLMEKNALK
ncbi:transporter substrate-binding domain-containing protein [Vibrio breoganii]|uniref:transporter substrate-binding domain-containing protein n=2 Tax=Vibrio TaxID=662 RepID=UPI0002FB669C|nr:transporter substrate-binding domain-containing protein [Vibrio breoganii]OED97203.1 cyclohexadienyl dehydratase [Vibrio breoganii ZF-29]PMO62311.1 cyclohexadienyl dehydratase [Vibrio breoganii]PMO80667.1 cyclohexadienyl dehydratase [Vibrio breoganii]PMO86176.1 cyclohexadienyl dehydratase [Vibrio breoganii]